MFRQVKLVSRQGAHVATVAVKSLLVAPEVLHWNWRYFVRHARHRTALEDEDVCREGICVNVVPIAGVAKNDGTDIFPPGPLPLSQQRSDAK